MRKNILTLGGWSVLALCLTANLNAATFYVDPVNGSMSGDGSAADPWSTLQEVFSGNLIESQKPASYPYVDGAPLVARNSGAPVQAGDTILLYSGDHGSVTIYGYYNADMVTIEAVSGETPVLEKFVMQGGKNWTLRGLTISKEPYGTPGTGDLVGFRSHGWQGPASDCVIEDCHIYSVDDITSWTASDWINKAGDGIYLGGARCVARNNLLRNVRFAIQATGDDGLVEYNEVRNFSGDGIRGLGDYSVYQYNLVVDCYDVDDNHDDGFQSWSDGPSGTGSGVVYGVEVRGNVFIETTDPTRSFNGPLQGIASFDGFFEDWIIENNVVAVDQWHGITLLGATNCTIANNTVIDQEMRSLSPWIMIGNHKDGSLSTGNTIVNNIARSFDLTGSTSSNNLSVTPSSYATYFVDPSNLDYRLVSGSPAIDAGTSTSAPSEDLMGAARPQGAGYDVGAYEYAPAILINGTNTDTPVNSDGTTPWIYNVSGRVGGSTGTLEGVMVYVFQLPELGAGETVLNANLDFTLLNIANGTFAGAADLYGLPYRASASVVPASDFYVGTYDGDASATAIQDAIMSNTQPAGLVSTNAAGDWNLAAYLAAQYDAGAVAGDFVFLRVNSNQLDHLPYRYWHLATADNSTVENRPVLSIEIGAE